MKWNGMKIKSKRHDEVLLLNPTKKQNSTHTKQSSVKSKNKDLGMYGKSECLQLEQATMGPL